jgi:hypothetical protein
MKFIAVLTVAISLFCFAAAVTITVYSDVNCGTAIPSTSNLTNPQVVPLNTCSPAPGSATSSLRYNSCVGGKAVASTYSDKVCSGANFITTVTFNTDVCGSDGRISTKITCAPASSVNVALAAVAAAAVLLFVQ